MLSESFSRYIREFRKPCGLKRADIISKLNKKLQYSQIHPQNLSNNPLRKVILNLQSNNSNFQFLFDELWRMCITANKEWFNFNITNVSYIQLAEYDAEYEGEYKKHQDVFWINNDQYHRKLTCVIQLTDPAEYEGGDLELFDLTEYPNAEQVRNQGTSIFFPSFVPHRAHPVTKGKRYSLAVWFEGPKWV